MVGWSQRSILEKLMAAEGIHTAVQAIECSSVDFMKSLLANSDHLAMLPSHALVTGDKACCIRPLPITIPELKREVAVIFHERLRLDDISQALISEIKAVGMTLS